MKKLLIFTLLAGAVQAQVGVQEILVKQSAPTAEGTNIRVNLSNGAGLSRISQVLLQARVDESQPWQTVKIWNQKHALRSYQRLALDYLPTAGQPFPELLTLPEFQVRAQFTSNGMVASSAPADYVANYVGLRMRK